jgi:hypothetical protein
MKKLLLIILLAAMIISATQCQKATNAATTGGSGGSTARFAISGNYLYTVDNVNLKVFDISTATDPVLKNTVPV